MEHWYHFPIILAVMLLAEAFYILFKLHPSADDSGIVSFTLVFVLGLFLIMVAGTAIQSRKIGLLEKRLAALEKVPASHA